MANYTKLKVIWKNNLNNIYKDNTIIGVGQEAVINMDENGISNIYVNFKVDNEFFTDLVEINGNVIRVPFKTDVLKAGTHQLEIVAYLKNGDVVPSPTFSYYVEKSLKNTDDIKADTHYPVLIELLEKVEEWNEKIPYQEEQRIANENERKSNEINRQSNENTRQSNESSRQQYETQRRVEEDERLTDEQVRVNAENIRIANENERLRKEIERQNAEELRQIAYNSSLYSRMDETEDRLNEVDSQLEHIEKGIYNYVNILDYGAKLDGVTDDSLALEKALNDGSVILPSNSSIFIGKTVHINKSCRILDGNGAKLYTNSDVTAFEISKLYCEELLNCITIKDFFVDMTRGGNFCTSYNSYFINFNDIRINGMKNCEYAIKVHNGFNITFKNVHVGGTIGELNTQSGNNMKGIHIYLSTTGINQSISGVVNATNILIDSCLIQRVKYGVYLEVEDGVFDTNKINNIGFSHCDYAFYECGGKNSSFLNQQISMMRSEYCGTSITNRGYLSVNNLYNYKSNYLIDNQLEESITSFKGMINHWSPDLDGCFVIYDNKGIIDFSKADDFNYTSNVGQKRGEGDFGLIRQLKTTQRKRNGSSNSLAINPFYVEVIDQAGYINLSTNVTNLINGLEFYMTSSNGTSIDLPNKITHRFADGENVTLHFMVVNGKLTVLNQPNLYIYDKISGSVTGTMGNNKIHFMDVNTSLTSFNFNKIGICILYSTTEGVTLSNGGNKILNFANLNSNNPFNLYNNPLIMIPLNDGSGKGLAIKC